MNKRKIITLSAGILCAVIILAGICMLFLSKTASAVSGAAVIIVSLASGLIIPNPLSFVGLIIGICMLFMPAFWIGMVLIIFGAIGAAVTLFFGLKKIKSAD